MRLVAGGCLALGIWVLSATPAAACDVALVGPARNHTTAALVKKADTIVIAVAREFTSTHPDPTLWFVPDDGMRVRFEILETLKGKRTSSPLIVPGWVSETDDFNDADLGANWARPQGRYGNCFAIWYRLGGTYLLFLKRVADGTLTPYWWALGRVNDQVHPGRDEWVDWVRRRVR